jgi:hypothetical protein
MLCPGFALRVEATDSPVSLRRERFERHLAMRRLDEASISNDSRSYKISARNTGFVVHVKSTDFEGPTLKERFEKHAAEWRRNTAFFSSVKDIALDSNYQQIIGMGGPVIPLILSDLEKGPAHWYWALAAITGENPAKDSPKGDIQAICDAWVGWGRRRGLLR